MRGEMERRLALRRVAEVEPVIDRMGAGGGGSAPQSLVTHRTSWGGTPTLGGRTDLTLSEAEAQAEAAMTTGGFDVDTDTAGVLVTRMVRLTYSATGDQTLYGYFRDFEIDGQGRVVSWSAYEFRTAIDAAEECL